MSYIIVKASTSESVTVQPSKNPVVGLFLNLPYDLVRIFSARIEFLLGAAFGPPRHDKPYEKISEDP